MKTLLHVGCGPNRIEQTPFARHAADWRETRLDVDAASSPDIIGTMTNMPAVASGTFDAVYSSHSIEHLYPHEVAIALAEFKRVLKPTGFALITCPDLQSICALVAAGELMSVAYMSGAGPISAIDMLYGHRPALAEGRLYMAHRCGFTQTVLADALKQAGFAGVASIRRAAYFDLWALAFVNRVEEPAFRATALQFFPA